MASVYVTHVLIYSHEVFGPRVWVLVNADRKGFKSWVSLAGGFVSKVPKVDTAAHPLLGSALCNKQTIYISLTGKTLLSFSENHNDFLFSRKYLFGLSMLIKMVTSNSPFLQTNAC